MIFINGIAYSPSNSAECVRVKKNTDEHLFIRMTRNSQSVTLYNVEAVTITIEKITRGDINTVKVSNAPNLKSITVVGDRVITNLFLRNTSVSTIPRFEGIQVSRCPFLNVWEYPRFSSIPSPGVVGPYRSHGNKFSYEVFTRKLLHVIQVQKDLPTPVWVKNFDLSKITSPVRGVKTAKFVSCKVTFESFCRTFPSCVEATFSKCVFPRGEDPTTYITRRRNESALIAMIMCMKKKEVVDHPLYDYNVVSMVYEHLAGGKRFMRGLGQAASSSSSSSSKASSSKASGGTRRPLKRAKLD